MKKVKQEEFESLIKEIIDGKKSKASVIKELQTESRTFNNKIQEMSATNPELYREFIKVHPYRPKERKDINIVGLVIEILKTSGTLEETCNKYNISYRTVSRKISQLQKSDKPEERDLYDLYKSVARKKSTAQGLSASEKYRIDKLEKQKVKGIDDIERKKQELLELEKKYQDLCMEVGKEEAAKRLGYTQNRIYKLLHELYRIEIEENERKKSATNDKSFRDSIKVEGIELGNNTSKLTKENEGVVTNTKQKIEGQDER